jgi:hypothetical protein
MRVGLLSLLLIAGGCAYYSRWSGAGQTPTPDDSIEGRWIGTLKSDSNGHSGGLRCIVSELDASHFKADFHATYGGIFSFGYQANMNVKATDGGTRPSVVYFAGEADLGRLAGGRYTYDGWATPTEFFCNYNAESDHGKFQLVRPGGAAVVRRE